MIGDLHSGSTGDLIAGLTLAAIAIPEQMATAPLAAIRKSITEARPK
jgi:MFS superfamily sulfate permease-like transporter